MTSQKHIDQQLVERIINQQDKSAFDILVNKYQQKLYRLVLRFVQDPSEAEDVVQETLIKAYNALPNFRGESAFYTWLYRIGVNTAKNFLISQKRKISTLNDNATSTDEAEFLESSQNVYDTNTPDKILFSKQLGEAFNNILDSLPKELSQAILLREIDGLAYDQIAEIMKCPVGTVRSRIFRAREIVATKLQTILGDSKNGIKNMQRNQNNKEKNKEKNEKNNEKNKDK